MRRCSRLTEDDLQALRSLSDLLLKRLHLMAGQPHILTLDLDIDHQDDALARLQQVT